MWFGARSIILATLVGGALAGGPSVRADDAVANALLVESVKLFKQAEAITQLDGQHGLYVKIRSNLQEILDEHPTSDLAVRISLGEKLGPLDLTELDKRIAATAPEKVARDRAIDAAVRRAIADTTQSYPGTFGNFDFTYQFTTFDPVSGTLSLIATQTTSNAEEEFVGKLEGTHNLKLQTLDGKLQAELSLDPRGVFIGGVLPRWRGSEMTIDLSAVVQLAIVNAPLDQCATTPTAKCLVEAALATAQAIEDPWARMSSLREITVAQAEAGDFLAALATAKMVEEPNERAAAFTQIVAAQAKAGDLMAALATVQAIGQSILRSQLKLG